MTAAEKPTESGNGNGTVNGNGNSEIGTPVLCRPHGIGNKSLDQSELALKPDVNRRVVFMRKLGGSEEGAVTEWSFEPPCEGEDVVQHTVALKRVVLDYAAADLKELCVLEMETKVDTGSVEKFPLAYLQEDKMQINLELFLSEATKVRLVKGKGPVYLIGEYAEEWREDEHDVEESCMEADEDANSVEDEESSENKENADTDGTGLRKRKLDENGGVLTKKFRSEDGTAAEPMDSNSEGAETNKA